MSKVNGNGIFFYSSEFNTERNSIRKNITIPEGDRVPIKYVPTGEPFVYKVTVSKELSSIFKYGYYNQIYDIGSSSYFDIVHTEENSNTLTHTIRLRTGDGYVENLFLNKDVNISRYSNLSVGSNSYSYVPCYDMSIPNEFVSGDVPDATQMPLIMYNVWVEDMEFQALNAINTYSMTVNDNMQDFTTSSSAGVIRNILCFTAFGYYSGEKIIKTNIKVNSLEQTTIYILINLLENATYVNSDKQTQRKYRIINTTISLLWTYGGGNGSFSVNTTRFTGRTFTAEGNTFNVLVTRFSKEEYTYNVRNVAEFYLTGGTTLTFELFGNTCVVPIEMNSRVASPVIEIHETIVPQGTFFNIYVVTGVGLETGGKTQKRLVMSFEVVGGVMVATSALEQYNLDNPSAYALAVKIPSQSEDFKYSQTVQGSLLKGGMGLLQGALAQNPMSMLQTSVNTAYDMYKAKETADFNKQQIQAKWDYEQANIKAKQGSISQTSNMFALVLNSNYKVIQFHINYVNSDRLQLLNSFYYRFGYALNYRATFPINTGTYYIETENSLYDVGNNEYYDQRVTDVCKQLDRGVLIIDN